MITPDGAITRCLFLSTSDPFLTKRLLAEVCALAIGLLPDLGVGLQEIDEVAGRDAEESGRIGDAAFAGSQDVEYHANRRPEARVLGREMEPAISRRARRSNLEDWRWLRECALRLATRRGGGGRGRARAA